MGRKRANYIAVKNYIHNDIKIAKQDILNVIKDTVKIEINKLLADESYLRTYIDSVIMEGIDSNNKSSIYKTIHSFDCMIDDEIRKTIFKEVKDRLVITLKDKPVNIVETNLLNNLEKDQ